MSGEKGPLERTRDNLSRAGGAVAVTAVPATVLLGYFGTSNGRTGERILEGWQTVLPVSLVAAATILYVAAHCTQYLPGGSEKDRRVRLRPGSDDGPARVGVLHLVAALTLLGFTLLGGLETSNGIRALLGGTPLVVGETTHVTTTVERTGPDEHYLAVGYTETLAEGGTPREGETYLHHPAHPAKAWHDSGRGWTAALWPGIFGILTLAGAVTLGRTQLHRHRARQAWEAAHPTTRDVPGTLYTVAAGIVAAAVGTGGLLLPATTGTPEATLLLPGFEELGVSRLNVSEWGPYHPYWLDDVEGEPPARPLEGRDVAELEDQDARSRSVDVEVDAKVLRYPSEDAARTAGDQWLEAHTMAEHGYRAAILTDGTAAVKGELWNALYTVEVRGDVVVLLETRDSSWDRDTAGREFENHALEIRDVLADEAEHILTTPLTRW